MSEAGQTSAISPTCPCTPRWDTQAGCWPGIIQLAVCQRTPDACLAAPALATAARHAAPAAQTLLLAFGSSPTAQLRALPIPPHTHVRASADALVVESLNAPFYFGVVKEARRQQAGKMEQLRREQAQLEEAASPSAAPRQQQQPARLQFVSPFQAQREHRAQQQQLALSAQPPARQASAAQALQQGLEAVPESPPSSPQREGSAQGGVDSRRSTDLQGRRSADLQGTRSADLQGRRSAELPLQGRRSAGGSLRRSIDQQRSAVLRQQQGFTPSSAGSGSSAQHPPARPGSLRQPSRDWSVDSPYNGVSTDAPEHRGAAGWPRCCITQEMGACRGLTCVAHAGCGCRARRECHTRLAATLLAGRHPCARVEQRHDCQHL